MKEGPRTCWIRGQVQLFSSILARESRQTTGLSWHHQINTIASGATMSLITARHTYKDAVFVEESFTI